MADDAGAAEDAIVDEAEDAPKKSGKKLILFGVIGLVVLIGAGAGVYFSGMLGGGDEAESAAAGSGAAGGGGQEGVAHYFDLDELVVTLGGAGRKSSFLKMRVSLELEGAADEARIKAVMPRIIDKFQIFLRELRIEELQGSQGLYRVKEELLARVNSAAHPTKIKDVLFREMLVQ
jgi:flagellar FliL protein